MSPCFCRLIAYCAAILLLVGILSGASGHSAWAGGGPENVFLLVNSESADSMEVANHYIHLRGIPSQNVFYLPWRRGMAVAKGKLFQEEILSPAIAEIGRRKLGGQIDYLVYSCDFPYQIDFTDLFPHNGPRNLAPKASLTGATYLYAFVQQKRREMFSLSSNFYCTSPDANVTVSRGFRSRYRWSPGGRRAGKGGVPYLLSSMLGVTFGRGNTTSEIAKYLATSAAADHSRPRGTVYLVKNSDIRSATRHNRYPAAVKELKFAGVNAQILEGQFPKGRKDIIGVSCGSRKIDLKSSQSRFLPGAFCDNLTSQGGQFFMKKTQTCISDFLRHGASGACGTVVEPMAVKEKFPMPTLHLHYARGCSMAESFYQSVAAPYQQLLVGDPLCKPGAERWKVTVVGANDGDTVRGELQLKPSADSESKRPIAGFELYVDGRRYARCANGGKLSLATTKLAEGYHKLCVVVTDATPIESQGRWTVAITVKNGRDSVDLRLKQTLASGSNKRLQFALASTTNDEFSLRHNGRELGRFAAGSLEIDQATLGSGPVTLFAESSGEAALRSLPLELNLD